jgi:hypothetical protein
MIAMFAFDPLRTSPGGRNTALTLPCYREVMIRSAKPALVILPALALAALTASCVGSPAHSVVDSDVELKTERFEADVEASLSAMKLSDGDVAYILAPLRNHERKVKAQPAGTWQEVLPKQPSLRQLAWWSHQLNDLNSQLQQRHTIPWRRLRHAMLTEDDFHPMELVAERMGLLANRGVYHYLPRSEAEAPRPVVRRWRRPVRIAATGDTIIDEAIALAVTELRGYALEMPLDDGSFPAPLAQANAFFGYWGIQCPTQAQCRKVDSSGIISSVKAENSVHQDQLAKLLFFGQFDKGIWISGEDIFPISAAKDGYRVAHYRANSKGEINLAACRPWPVPRWDSSRPTTSEVPRLPEEVAEVRLQVRECLSAMLGAPAAVPLQLLRPAGPDDIYLPKLRRPSIDSPTIDQSTILAQLYGGERFP